MKLVEKILEERDRRKSQNVVQLHERFRVQLVHLFNLYCDATKGVDGKSVEDFLDWARDELNANIGTDSLPGPL